ncbi:amidohydrolase family protein [Jiella avicenniae]|uniref:Amidohydrolase family protein n=1 Tax=Jiella avicenniae TaxID=2907202 RepID=A0A9X1P1W9_9HYPH|nr:amidohydrolase family protein [Jiella avicenniae]MCE7029902.1 amidohydrolase family protein [Jiella avicenniae]
MATFDFILRKARIGGRDEPVDIGVAKGRIAAIETALPQGAPERPANGRFVCTGLVDAHIHLDKAGILGRCPICDGTLKEAVSLTAEAKADFTPQDVYARAETVLEAAIVNGTVAMRSFVETDPRVGLASFEALVQLKRDHAAMIDLDLCAFAQEGLTQEMATHDLLIAALEQGASSVGGCPYTDPDPVRHIDLILDLAERFDVPADFHIDFDLDPDGSDLPSLIAATRRRGLQGRVSIGHASKLSAMAPDEFQDLAEQLAGADIGVVVLPATDLYLMGRGADRLAPRGMARADLLAAAGVRTAVATNNVLNPFTPFGDASLIRMANLFANVAQIGADEEIARSFAMVSDGAASVVGLSRPSAPAVGAPADLLILDAASAVDAVRRIAQPVAGWKAGRQTFERPLPRLFRGDADGG